MTCEFCNYFVSIEPQRIVYEDEDYMAFIAREPVVNGHCIVIPKEHSEFITGVPNIERFFKLISFLCQAIKDAVDASDIKIETRYGHENHKVDHTHVHLVPSFATEEGAIAAGKVKNSDERILENLRKSSWYKTLNS